MVAALLLASTAQGASPAEINQTARDLLGPEQVSNRVDCVSREVTETGEATLPGDSEINEIFLFSMRPHLQSAEVRAQLRYVTTMNDGRTFLHDGRIESITWERWPNFSARIALSYGWVDLDSDPSVAGRLLMRGRYLTAHGPDIVARGECRFVPPVPTNEVAPQ